MSKFKTTTYANPVKVELIPGGKKLPVIVDDAGLSANSEGKKIVAKGTVIGGGAKGAGVFSDPTKKVKACNAAKTGDVVSTGTNNDLTITNLTGEVLKIALIDPAGNSKPLYASIVGDTINVNLATSGAGAITSTGAEIVALLNSDWNTKRLVSAANKGTDTGASAVTAVGAVTIDGTSLYYPEGVLLTDVDVTYGPAPGAMIIDGIIDRNKISVQPSAYAQAALPQIAWSY